MKKVKISQKKAKKVNIVLKRDYYENTPVALQLKKAEITPAIFAKWMLTQKLKQKDISNLVGFKDHHNLRGGKYHIKPHMQPMADDLMSKDIYDVKSIVALGKKLVKEHKSKSSK